MIKLVLREIQLIVDHVELVIRVVVLGIWILSCVRVVGCISLFWQKLLVLSSVPIIVDIVNLCVHVADYQKQSRQRNCQESGFHLIALPPKNLDESPSKKEIVKHENHPSRSLCLRGSINNSGSRLLRELAESA